VAIHERVTSYTVAQLRNDVVGYPDDDALVQFMAQVRERAEATTES
jgi:hypothetical protein